MKNARFAACLFLGAVLSIIAPTQLSAASHMKAKDHKPHLTIYYTPRPAVSGGTGKWQLIVVDPEGKKHKSQHIDFVTPPDHPKTLKVHNAKHGIYTIMVYVTKRTNDAPVDITSLATDMFIKPSSGKDNYAIPVRDFTGNRTSTIANDTAQARYTFMHP